MNNYLKLKVSVTKKRLLEKYASEKGYTLNELILRGLKKTLLNAEIDTHMTSIRIPLPLNPIGRTLIDETEIYRQYDLFHNALDYLLAKIHDEKNYVDTSERLKRKIITFPDKV